jgi:hypothetical protein
MFGFKKNGSFDWYDLNEWQYIKTPLANGFTKSVQQRKQISLTIEGLIRWVDVGGYDVISPTGDSQHVYPSAW